MRTKHLAALFLAVAFGMGPVAFAAPVSPPADALKLLTNVTRETTELKLLLALNGRPTYLGRISATTSAKNNADATAFDIPESARVLLICVSAAVRVLPDTNVTEDITTANGVPIEAGKCWWMILQPTDVYLQAITESSTSNVDVWRLD